MRTIFRIFAAAVFSAAIVAPAHLWASVHPRGVSFGDEFNVVKFDAAAGKMPGRIEGRSRELGIGLDGSLYPASRSDLLAVFRPRT